MTNKGKSMLNKKIPSELRVYKTKIDKIIKLEKNYWKDVQKRRSFLNEFNPILNDNLEQFFPSNISIRIYACKDGIVLLRYVISNLPNKFEILYTLEDLKTFTKHVPIPSISGDHIIPAVFGPSTDLRMIDSNFSGVIIEWMSYSAYFYNDNERMMLLEDALTDFKIYATGLINDQNLKPLDNKIEDKKSINESIKSKINAFKDLLEIATTEEEIQKYLKENPILIQTYSELIPKQKLGEDFVTDFVLVNIIDQGPKYTFVELEKADMPIFTKNKEFTSQFKHTEKQISDWDIWLQENQNYIKRKLIGFEYPPKYLIIAGRSVEMDEKDKRYIRAYNRNHHNIEFLTYDDIIKKSEELFQSYNKQKNHEPKSSGNQKTPKPEYEFDVVLSFAGEDRLIVEKYVSILKSKSKSLTVFYDEEKRSELWGKNLVEELYDIYKNKARYCILFISKHYLNKMWTNHERQAAQERALKEKSEYILPIKLDDTELPGMPTTIGYLDLRVLNIEEIASETINKLEKN